MSELKCSMLEESLPLIEECVEIVMHPVVDQQVNLALGYLGKIQKILNRLLIPEPVA